MLLLLELVLVRVLLLLLQQELLPMVQQSRRHLRPLVTIRLQWESWLQSQA